MDRFIWTTDIDQAEREQGYVAEIIDLQGDPEDGGPIAIARCFRLEDADRIVQALRLPGKF